LNWKLDVIDSEMKKGCFLLFARTLREFRVAK